MPNQSVLQPISSLAGRQQVSRGEESSDMKELLDSQKELLVMRVRNMERELN